MPTIVKLEDPRVKRTRQLLIEAFAELSRDRSLRSISVQDIAEKAAVNRATFYAHFADKYDLLEAWIRDSFRAHLVERVPPTAKFSRAQLSLFISIVLEQLRRTLSGCRATNREYHPLVESAVQDELHKFLLEWLKQADGNSPLSLETTASVMSWAIFGVGTRLHRNPQTSIDQVADEVMTLLTQGLAATMPGLFEASISN